MRRAKVDVMTTRNLASATPPAADEASRLRRIAARHGLSEDSLVEFVADTRRQARNRRRRLSDAQIEALVASLGGQP
jgi:hypothetical protein